MQTNEFLFAINLIKPHENVKHVIIVLKKQCNIINSRIKVSSFSCCCLQEAHSVHHLLDALFAGQRQLSQGASRRSHAVLAARAEDQILKVLSANATHLLPDARVKHRQLRVEKALACVELLDLSGAVNESLDLTHHRRHLHSLSLALHAVAATGHQHRSDHQDLKSGVHSFVFLIRGRKKK